jgi:hypothetical protein
MCKKFGFIIQGLDENLMIQLGPHQVVILSQLRRICAQVEQPGFSVGSLLLF